jgi:hypothetical protein
MFDRGVVHIVVGGYNFDHYCLRFERGVEVMVNNITSHNNMNHSSVKHQTVMVNNVTSHNNMNHFSVKPQTVMVNNITATTI